MCGRESVTSDRTQKVLKHSDPPGSGYRRLRSSSGQKWRVSRREIHGVNSQFKILVATLSCPLFTKAQRETGGREHAPELPGMYSGRHTTRLSPDVNNLQRRHHWKAPSGLVVARCLLGSDLTLRGGGARSNDDCAY